MTKLYALVIFRSWKLRGGNQPFSLRCCWLYCKTVARPRRCEVSLWLFLLPCHCFLWRLFSRSSAALRTTASAYCASGNARHLPLMPQDSVSYPGSARRSLLDSGASESSDNCALPARASHPAGPFLAFLFLVRSRICCPDHIQSGRKTLSMAFSGARDFSCSVAIFHRAAIFRPISSVIPRPLRRITHGIQRISISRLSCTSPPVYSSLPNTPDMAIFAASAVLPAHRAP